MSKIIRRVLTILPAVLLQVLWLYILFEWLTSWAVVINSVLFILSFLFVLYLITKQDESMCRQYGSTCMEETKNKDVKEF